VHGESGGRVRPDVSDRVEARGASFLICVDA
jgi:hypothetical protein